MVVNTVRAALRNTHQVLEQPAGAMAAVARISGARTNWKRRCGRWDTYGSTWHWGPPASSTVLPSCHR
ncbi:hypothetical protein FB157_11192 [Streptomyces sp. BK340]|nr:hypothetical protein FB157_11192 [Streptomyces sp. BK340]